jgi:hypothetical protein
MKISDIVEFHSNSWIIGDGDYINPGIVIAKLSDKRHIVLWADKRTTTEHTCYLRLAKEDTDR